MDTTQEHDMSSDTLKKINGFQARGGEVLRMDPTQVIIAGVDRPVTDETWFLFCPRADEPVDAEFVDDIRKNGNRDPADGYKAGSDVYILEGRRRTVACRTVWAEEEAAGVPFDERKGALFVMVRGSAEKKSDPKEMFALNVSAEATRKALTPLQRAALMEAARTHGLTDAEIAGAFGYSERTVLNTLALLDMSSEVQHAVETGDVPIREAIKLAKMSPEDQAEVVHDIVEAGASHGAAAANAIHKIKQAKKRGKKAEVVKQDKTKMISKTFLERWLTAVEYGNRVKANVRLTDVLRFILTAKPHHLDPSLHETLAEAGFRGRGFKAPKPVKKPKPKAKVAKLRGKKTAKPTHHRQARHAA